MQKIILKYGFISGIIVSVIMLITMNYYSHCGGEVNWNTRLIIGYTSMLFAFSMVYFGIKNYRDQYNNGVISFGKHFKCTTIHFSMPCLLIWKTYLWGLSLPLFVHSS